ncbi:MAG: hypothetical protein A2176_02145 [Spirochaetes bacterium RBG_13_51_14]|nr:MAG: hypothetical protein A2176_02145 [Spirochaetes bacterium RBG_13_51_14]
MAKINFAKGAKKAGLAVMMADMIKANLKQKPEREKDLNALNGNIYLHAEDAEVDMTMVFKNGSLTVYRGKVGDPMISIAADSVTLLDLANISIKFGLPFYFDARGLAILWKLLTRQLKLKGLITHPIALTRFTKLMSVR